MTGIRRSITGALRRRRTPDSSLDRESLELFRAAYDIVVEFDAELRIASFTPSQSSALGRPADELIGRSFASLLHPDDVATAEKAVASPAVRRRIRDLRTRTADGGWQWIEATFVRSRTHAGRTWALCRGSRGSRGISDAERSATSGMDAVAWRARRIAHQLNNLLHVIRGHSETHLELGDPSQEVRTLLHDIEASAERGAALVRQLIQVADGLPGEPLVIDALQELARAKQTLESLVGFPVRIASDPEVEVLLARVDPGALELILASLLVNLSDGEGAERGATLRPIACEDGEGVAIEVERAGTTQADTGRRFDPFSTRSEDHVDGGHGLGFVMGLLDQHGGSLEVEATSKGRCFRIVLPRVRVTSPSLDSVSQQSSPGIGDGQTVLLVEDADEVRALTVRMLEGSGYRVLQARDGKTATDIVQNYDDPIDLLVADLILPGEGGQEVRDRITALRPGIRTLFVSGFPEILGSPTGSGEEEPRILAKPFLRNELIHAVRETLRS